MRTFTIRDLRQKTGELVRQAESGDMSLITKHGRPVFIALPMNELLVQSGVHQALAVKLYEQGVVSLSKAARLAGVALEVFLEQLGRAGVDVVSYSAAELDTEAENLDRDGDQ